MNRFNNFTLRSDGTTGQVDGTTNTIPGWVSGTPGGLAASGSADCIFDLGMNWDKYGLVQFTNSDISGSSGVTIAFARSSDNITVGSSNYTLNHAFGTSANVVTGTSSPGGRTFMVRPMARYLIVRLTNADAVNAVGAAAWAAITAYPL